MANEGGSDEQFSYRETKDGRVQLFSAGRLVKTLTKSDATRFLSRIASYQDADATQLLMAKATGQFRFGNERRSKLKGKRV